MTPAGQRDYSSAYLTRHALERFVERFGATPEDAPAALRAVLTRTRRLGRNAANGAVAVLGVHHGRALVAVLQGTHCLTVLTWNQFLPHLADFGRPHLPRKWSRVLRRLVESPPSDDPDADADHVADSQHGHPRPPRTL